MGGNAEEEEEGEDPDSAFAKREFTENLR